jgi:DNA-binding NarL/FixJ family response regulator
MSTGMSTDMSTGMSASMSASIRVVVADDHPIVRAGIVALLSQEADIAVVGEAANGQEVVRLTAEMRPDLVLMDLRMPLLSGAAATAEIVAAFPRTRVLILTTYETDADILGAIEAGASGYLLKAAPQEEILEGVRSAVGGQTVLAPAIAARLVDRLRGDGGASDRTRLSPRELDVLRLVAAGNSNAEIAARLFISEATVKTHLVHAFEKLGVSDRTRAVTLALERGLI